MNGGLSSVFASRKNNGVLWEPDANTVLWLPGQDDAYSATIRDRSGKGNNGTITGATWKRAAKGLWYPDYDGSDDLVTANGVVSSEVFGNAFTVLGWGKLSNWTGTKVLFCGGKAATDTEYTEMYYHAATNTLRSDTFNVAGGTNLVISAGIYDNDSDWHFLAMAVDADGHLNRFIIDGADIGSEDTNANDLSGFDRCYIGQLEWTAANTSVWQGGIALMRVITLELTTIQLLNIRAQERHLFGV